MAIYRGKYILEGLDEIPPQMIRDLDVAYDICKRLHDSNECKMCGRCCHQPNITVMDDEIERMAVYLEKEIYDFVVEYLYRDNDRWLFRKEGGCRFLGDDNKCTIWPGRPEICGDFPYMVSKFMSRIYLAITHDEYDIDLSYMDDTWPCTSLIKDSVAGMINEAKEKRTQEREFSSK